MTIDLTCQKCDGEFELDVQDLVDGSEKLECPHCGVKASQTATDDFTAALAELNTQVALLAKKFSINFEIDTDDVAPAAAPDEAADDDEESDFDDEDDDDEDDDEDDDDEDLDEDDETSER